MRGRTTGMSCFCWQSSSTTTTYILPQQTHAWLWKTPMDGLWATPGRVLTGNGQWVPRPDGLNPSGSQVHSCKGQGWHGTVLQLMPNSGTRVSGQRQGVLGCELHLHYTPLSEACPLLPQPLHGSVESQKECILPLPYDIHVPPPPCLQCDKASSDSRWPNSGSEGSSVASSRNSGQRGALGGGMDPRQPIHEVSPPVPHEMGRIWVWRKFMGSRARCYCPDKLCEFYQMHPGAPH